MDLTTWPVVIPINQKNYYTDYLKRDEQILAYRLQQEDARNKMVKQARDKDRALAQGRPIGPDGDVEMDDDQDEIEDEVSTGTKTVVIHIGSQNLRIGLASDALPKTVPMVIARRAERAECEEGGDEPTPKRIKLDEGRGYEPEKQFGEGFAKKFQEVSTELKVHMRMNKRRVLPQSRDMVVSYNRRTTHDTITEHNDTLQIEWTDVAPNGQLLEHITGKEALRIPDKSNPRFKLYWPIRQGLINEIDYNSERFLYEDIRIIIEEAAKNQLGIIARSPKDWAQYSCVMVIPDYYEKKYATNLLDLVLTNIGFSRVTFVQESLAASFGAGFTTCCIVDMGAQKTSISCVEDGMVIEHSRINLKMGGNDVTEIMIKMMLYNHFPYQTINLRTRYDFQLAEELKAKFLTLNEADVSVQLYDFHLRAPGQDTRKYTFKCYDEVFLAPSGFFKPNIFEHHDKVNGRRRLVDMSYDIYEGKPNDPLSTAQEETLKKIAPPELLTNGVHKDSKVNGNVINSLKNEAAASHDGSRRPSLAKALEQENTPAPSHASSPVRQLDGTPDPDDLGSPRPLEDRREEEERKPEEPLPLERRDDILPVCELPEAIIRSITHAAGLSGGKTRDFLGSIMLIGGSSAVPGMAPYLEDTLKGLLPSYSKEILISRPPRELDPQVVTWKGAAVFGRMTRTNDSWINLDIYERLGARVLNNKLLFSF